MLSFSFISDRLEHMRDPLVRQKLDKVRQSKTGIKALVKKNTHLMIFKYTCQIVFRLQGRLDLL